MPEVTTSSDAMPSRCALLYAIDSIGLVFKRPVAFTAMMECPNNAGGPRGRRSAYTRGLPRRHAVDAAVLADWEDRAQLGFEVSRSSAPRRRPLADAQSVRLMGQPVAAHVVQLP